MRNEPLPITLLTGFLGSGKTTLLRHTLQAPHEQRIAVIMNEVDQAGIEQKLAEQAYLELTAGCVCCVRNPDLIEALQTFAARDDVDRVILETTGLADPLQLAWTVQRPELSGLVRLDAIITALDPTAFTRSAVSEWEAQVEAADVGVITKLDVATPAERAALEARVHALNPQLRLLATDNENLAAVLFDATRDPLEHHARVAPAPGAKHSSFIAQGLSGGRYSADHLEQILEHLPMNIFRAKGVVDTDEGWLRFHLVAGRLQVEPNIAPPEHAETRMSFFGNALPLDQVSTLLAPAKLG